MFCTPGLACNLISVSKCRIAGFYSRIVDDGDSSRGTFIIYDKDNGKKQKKVVGVETSSGLYEAVIRVKSTSQHVSLSKGSTEDGSTTHRRFGHVSHETLRKSISLVEGLDKFGEFSDCTLCPVAKECRKPRPASKAPKSQRPLDLVYSDVVGPIKTPTVGHSRFFITLLDDYSG